VPCPIAFCKWSKKASESHSFPGSFPAQAVKPGPTQQRDSKAKPFVEPIGIA
jgi:hypothetical protein